MDKVKVVIDKKTIEVKTYLTTKEIETIVYQMLNKEDYLTKIMTRDILILYFCTDIDIQKDESGAILINPDIYDKYQMNNTISSVLENIDEKYLLLIEECVQYEESMSKVLEKFLNELNEKLDKYMNDNNTEDIINKLGNFNFKQLKGKQ